jgi:hypothetical protein
MPQLSTATSSMPGRSRAHKLDKTTFHTDSIYTSTSVITSWTVTDDHALAFAHMHTSLYRSFQTRIVPFLMHRVDLLFDLLPPLIYINAWHKNTTSVLESYYKLILRSPLTEDLPILAGTILNATAECVQHHSMTCTEFRTSLTSDPITIVRPISTCFQHNFTSIPHDWDYLIRLIVSSSTWFAL